MNLKLTQFDPKQLAVSLLPPGILGHLRSARVHRQIATYKPRIVEHTFGGRPLSVYLADPVSEAWYDKDWGELPEVAALRRSRLRPGARVFNLGAHQGVIAMMLADCVGETGQVVAVEANPHNAAVAARNFELNGLRQIELLHAAVSAHRGKIVFNESLNGQLDDGTGSRGKLEVDSVTIDDLVARFGHPDIVFMDIEGAECLALSAASAAFQGETDFFVEVHVGCGLEHLGGTSEALLSYFDPNRFELLGRVEGGAELRPLRPGDSTAATRFMLLALDRAHF
jgi:FkbM family methyltransferase